ncbi:MAG: hypothetical protein JWO50_63 [Candidatus Kaiserbacteria bacterium]|nr:hypothetical protein [Candidatus Kaiserbacteria bacterium]
MNTISIQRYIFTPVLAVLLWPLMLGLIGDSALFNTLLALPMFAAIMFANILCGTFAGVFVFDGLTSWSSGETELVSLRATASRVGIGIIASIVFSIHFASMTYTNFLDVFLDRGLLTVVPAAWIAASIVDLLVRKYAPKETSKPPANQLRNRR